jgi:hypothetical protein
VRCFPPALYEYGRWKGNDERTFARRRANDEDAPKAVICETEIRLLLSPPTRLFSDNMAAAAHTRLKSMPILEACLEDAVPFRGDDYFREPKSELRGAKSADLTIMQPTPAGSDYKLTP